MCIRDSSYAIRANRSLLTQFYKGVIKAREEALIEELKGKERDYLKENLAKADEKVKEQIYPTIAKYAVNSVKK